MMFQNIFDCDTKVTAQSGITRDYHLLDDKEYEESRNLIQDNSKLIFQNLVIQFLLIIMV